MDEILQEVKLVQSKRLLFRPYPHSVVTLPIAGPEAGGFARVSPKPWHAKG
jgi:hypothetical protein